MSDLFVAPTHDRTVDRVQLANASVFVIAALTLFVITVRGDASAIGVGLLAWLFVFGAGALWLDHQLLQIARRARGDVPFRELFGRALRRNLRERPEYLFARPEDAAAYRAAYRRVLQFLGVSVVLLVAITSVFVWPQLVELHYVLYRAKPPTL
jgi:hypothetical protein